MSALIEKFPFKIALVLYAASLWMRFDAFESDPASPYLMLKNQITVSEGNQKQLQQKIREATEFFRSLESKRAEVQALARELSEMKTVLPETIDSGGFMKTLISEAQRVGLRVTSLKPKDNRKEEYYAEQSYELAFRGVYAQVVVLFERLNSMASIMRIDDIVLKRDGTPVSPYVELEGSLILRIYRYVGSRADEVARASSGASVPQAPAAPAAAAPTGGGK